MVNPPADTEDAVWSLGKEDPLERRDWQPTPLFLPGKSHGQRNLAGCNLWDRKESDMTEHANIECGSDGPSRLVTQYTEKCLHSDPGYRLITSARQLANMCF